MSTSGSIWHGALPRFVQRGLCYPFLRAMCPVSPVDATHECKSKASVSEQGHARVLLMLSNTTGSMICRCRCSSGELLRTRLLALIVMCTCVC